MEIAIPKGTDTSGYSIVIYDSAGFVEATLSLGLIVNTMGGMDVYLVDDTTGGWTYIDPGEAVALVDDTGTVLQFVSHGGTLLANDGPAAGQTSTLIGLASPTESLQSDNGGISYYNQATPNPGVIPCYAPGTLIRTPDGERPVENISPGDLVDTKDAGPQPVLWVNSAQQPLEQVSEDQRPVLIRAGTLAPDVPKRDLVVSPQHRIIVGGPDQLSHFARAEVFVPAKTLTVLAGIRPKLGSRKATWIQFAFDRHHVVWADGCLSESLLLGPMVVNGLSAEKRAQLAKVFPRGPDHSQNLNGSPARPCLSVDPARTALTRMLGQITRAA